MVDDPELAVVVRNIDARLSRVEQYLPQLTTHEGLTAAIALLATQAELREAIAPLATKEELRAAIVPLATKEELRAAIAPLATKEELRTAIATLPTREEMEAGLAAARRHTTVLFESLRDDNRLIVEHLLVLSSRVDALTRR